MFFFKYLSLEHDNPKDFYCMKFFCFPVKTIWAIRVLFTIYTIASILFSIIYSKDPEWLKYLTNWGLVVTVVYFVWAISLSGIYDFKIKNQITPVVATGSHDITLIVAPESHDIEKVDKRSGKTPFHLKLFWLWFTLTYLLSCIIVVMYWTVLVGRLELNRIFLFNDLRSFQAVNAHGLTLFLLLVDLHFHRIPIKFAHVVYGWCLALLYAFMSVIYNFSTGYPIYPALDWIREPFRSFLYVLITFGASTLVQALLWLLDRLKKRQKFGSTRELANVI